MVLYVHNPDMCNEPYKSISNVYVNSMLQIISGSKHRVELSNPAAIFSAIQIYNVACLDILLLELLLQKLI